MKSSTFAAAFATAFAALVSAQGFDTIPECARSCIKDAIRDHTKCSVDDVACACKNVDSIKNVAAGCVVEKCGIGPALGTVLPAVKAICDKFP